MIARQASRLRLRTLCLAALISALCLGLVFAGVAAASTGTVTLPHWQVEARAAPTNLPVDGNAGITVSAANIGDAEAKAPIRVVDLLPAGVEVTGEKQQPLPGGTFRYSESNFPEEQEFKCTHQPSELECTMGKGLEPFETIYVLLRVKTTGLPSSVVNTLDVYEGANLVAEQKRTIKTGEPPEYGIEPGGFELTPENEKFETDHQSGDHPFQLTTTVNFNQTFESVNTGAAPVPSAPALSKNVTFKLPAGLIGDAAAVPQCTDAEFAVQEVNNRNACPEDTVVGVADVTLNDPHPNTNEFDDLAVPVFNLEPGKGEPARFGFETFHVPVVLNTSVRTGEDYGATISVDNASDAVDLLGTRVTIWGTPADPRHDNARGWQCMAKGSYDRTITPTAPVCGELEEHNERAFLTLPTSCSGAGNSQTTEVSGEAWGGELLPPEVAPAGLELNGCQNLELNPTLEVKTDEHTASTPSGMTVEVSVPQEGTLTEGELAEADVKATTLELPSELQTSAGAANSLETCGVAQAGFEEIGATLGEQLGNQRFSFVEEPIKREEGLEASCPDASKIGTVEIDTPFLGKLVEGKIVDTPLNGSLYLASQDTNPFASPLVLYLIAEEPESKVLVKLAGEVKIESNGQLVSKFTNTPQAAFEHLKLHLFNGSSSGAETASQATPARCGGHSARAEFESWAQGPNEERSSNPEGLAITSGPHGTACTNEGEKLPFAPGFQAGSTNPEAAKYSPFTLTIARPDGSQALKGIDMELPPGLAAKLASVPLCGEPQAKEGTCGEESLIGVSTTYSGLGNAPVSLAGKVYLTGPYEPSPGVKAPFGLSTVTDATKVGPFNIGRIVARSTINVNETTAAANINTEKTLVYPSTGGVEEYAGLPEFIKGLPAQIKQLNVTVNRPEFEFNPTNCNAMAVTGTLAGSEGTNASVSTPFKATNCAALAFEPKMTASVVGQGSKTEGTTFAVKIEFPKAGQANIHKVDLTIPSKLPSRLTTIQKACLEKVFNENPASCDEGSVIGEGVVHTPVFKNPLRGPAYLVSHGGAAFPDVEFVLQGEGVKIVVDGKTFIHEGVTYSKFETSPDAPFSTFETVFPKGPHSALTPSVPEKEDFNLCKQTLTIPTEITAQNGAFMTKTLPVAITGCKGVAGFKVTKAQLLAKALKACKTKYKAKSKKAKRVKCEKAAHKKYGPPVKKPSKKHSSKKK
jgi:hypothetical protein